jgi:hypothetical protein
MPTPEEFLCGGRFCHPSRYRRKPSLSSLHQNHLEHAPRRAGRCNLHFDSVLARSSLTQIKCKLQSHKTLLANPFGCPYLLKIVAGFDSTITGWF